MSFREQKQRARAQLHEAMKVEAYCYPNGGKRAKLVSVRVHTEFVAAGDMKGTSYTFAERRDQAPYLLFLRETHEPVRGDIVMVSTEEGYRIDNVDPPYNITTKAYAVALPKNELAMFLAPPVAPVYGRLTGLMGTISGSAGTPGYGQLVAPLGQISGELIIV